MNSWLSARGSRVLAAAALALLFTAFSGYVRAEPYPAVIRFGGFGQGFGKPYGTALLAIAQVKGFLADEFKGTPVKLSYEYFTGTGPAINEAIANDQIDFAQYGSLPNIVGRAAGLPTRALTSYGYTTIFGVSRVGLPVNSVADVKGRKVSVTKGTVIHWALLKALQENGLGLKDITLIDLKSADQLAALSAGSVDVVFGTSTLLPLRDQGVVKVFYTSKDLGAKASGFGAITVTDGFLQKYPSATGKVTRALVRAADWLGHDENREEAYRIWAQSGVSIEALRDEFSGVSLREVFNPRVDDFFIGQYRDAVAFAKDQKLIRNDFDVQGWFVPKYVDQALVDLKLTKAWPRRSVSGAPLDQ